MYSWLKIRNILEVLIVILSNTSCTIHIDLKGEKVWLQQDWTDSVIAEQLMELGVEKEDIVLAFYSPFRRADTGFAAA